MERVLEERTFTIGPFSPSAVARAWIDFEKKRAKADEDHEIVRQACVEVGMEPPQREHIPMPTIVAKKKEGVIAGMRRLLQTNVNESVGPNGITYTPSYSLYGIEVVLREALANAIIHGARYDAGKEIQVRQKIWEDIVGLWRKIHMVVHVIDPGSGFDISAVPDPTAKENRQRPTGRGLLLMTKLVEAEFLGKGNEVRLQQTWEQDCKAPPAA